MPLALPGRPRDPQSLALIAITVVAGVLRFATLDVQSFDFDEAFAVDRVLDGSLGRVFDALPATESNPPTWYLMAWVWTNVFGAGEVGLRSLSAAAGTALVPVIYLAGRELVSRRAGLVAAALAAANPLLVFYSQQGRNYALFTLCASLSIWAFARARADASVRRLGWWAAACALAVSVHYFAVFLFAAEAALLIVAPQSRRRALVAAAVPAAIGVALIPLAVAQADGRTEWIADQPLGTRIRQVASKFLVGEVDPVSNGVLLVVAGALAAAVAYGVTRAGPGELRGGLLAATLAAVTMATPVALDIAGFHYVLARNLIGALPAGILAAGAFLAARRAHPAGLTAAGIMAALSLAAVLAVPVDARLQRPDFRGAAKQLGIPPPDTAVVVPYYGRAPLELYLKGARPRAGRLRVRTVEVIAPVTRRDSGGPVRIASPPPPPDFALARRYDTEGFTRMTFRAARPVQIQAESLHGLLSAVSASEPPVVLTRPR